MVGYWQASLEDVYNHCRNMKPGDPAHEFNIGMIPSPQDLESLMVRLSNGRENITFTYSRDGLSLKIHCRERVTTVE